MARVRSPNRDKAKQIYLEAKGNIKLIDIAAKLGVGDTLIRKWKSQDKWDKELKGTLLKVKSNVTNKKVNNKGTVKEPIADEVKEVLKNTELNDKQRLFCIYYIKSFNATKAYKKAYGCTYESAMVNGSNLLRNVKIKAEIERLKQNKLNRAMLSEEDIFQKYIDIAFSDISDYLKFGKKYSRCWGKDEEGNDIPVIDPETGRQKVIDYSYVELTDDVYENDTSIISEISQGKDGIKIKLEDKMKALQWLSEHVDLLTVAQQEKLKLEKKAMELKERVVDNEVF